MLSESADVKDISQKKRESYQFQIYPRYYKIRNKSSHESCFRCEFWLWILILKA